MAAFRNAAIVRSSRSIFEQLPHSALQFARNVRRRFTTSFAAHIRSPEFLEAAVFTNAADPPIMI